MYNITNYIFERKRQQDIETFKLEFTGQVYEPLPSGGATLSKDSDTDHSRITSDYLTLTAVE